MRNQSLLLWVLLLVDRVSGNQEYKVKVGDSVTLLTGVTELPNDTVQWWFDKKIIAKINKAAETSKTFEGPDEIFKDKLQLNKQTGSLTIKDIRPEHAGIYQLQIKGKTEKWTNFSVIVHVTVMKGDSFSLHTGDKVQGYIWIQWKFEGQVIPTGGLNGAVEERWSNIHLNNKTGELRFVQIQMNQSGNYEVEANTGSFIVHKKFLITVADSHWEKTGPIALGVAVFLGVILILIMVKCCCDKCCQKK